MLNSVLILSIYSTVLSLCYYTNHEIYTGVIRQSVGVLVKVCVWNFVHIFYVIFIKLATSDSYEVYMCMAILIRGNI